MFLREMYGQKGSKYIFTGKIKSFVFLSTCIKYFPINIFIEEQLLMILLDLFLAGFNTTAITLDFLFLHMVVHQDVQQKVREEIATKIGLDEFPKLEDRSK